MDDQLLIGREREQAQLRAWAADALAGRGSLVLLAGEAGVGKTTLARRALAGSGLEVLEGVGVQGGTSAFGPVVEVLRAHLRIEGGGPLVEGPLAAHLALLLPELGPPAAEGDRATLFEAIRLALAAIAARRPAALLLDDLQWADDATLELLAALARSLDTQPLLVLGAFRSDELPRDHPIRRLRSELRRAGRLRQVTVEPLEAEATAALLERTLGAAGPSLRRAVFDRTDGVPFFVNELGSALAASGRLEAGPSGLELLEGEDVPLPDSVRDAVLLRAAGLSDDARVAVLTAAVAGQTFDPELVTAVAGLPEWPDELLRQGIVAGAAPAAWPSGMPWSATPSTARSPGPGGWPCTGRWPSGWRPPMPPRWWWPSTGPLAGGPSRPGRRCWWRPRRSVPCTPTGTPSGPPAGPWSCGRRSATRAPAAPAWTCSSASPAAPSWPATWPRPARSGARSPTGAGGRATRSRSGRRSAGWPPSSSSRAAGRRRWPAGSRPPAPSPPPAWRPRPPPNGSPRPPTSGRPGASGPP